MALIVGPSTFDPLFAGIHFEELDGDILFVHAKDKETAAEVEDNFWNWRCRSRGRLGKIVTARPTAAD